MPSRVRAAHESTSLALTVSSFDSVGSCYSRFVAIGDKSNMYIYGKFSVLIVCSYDIKYSTKNTGIQYSVLSPRGLM